MSTTRRTALKALAAGALSGLAPGLRAQAYPARPIRLIVPFAPEGAADLSGRLLVERLGNSLGQPMLVENMAGRGGTVGSEYVSRAAPDGYTLLWATNATMITGPIYSRAPSYDPLVSFTPITLIAFMKTVLVVNPKLPARDFGELIALIEASPRRYRYAHAGAGSHSHLSGRLFRAQTKLELLEGEVPGIVAAREAVISGRADMMFEVSLMMAPAVGDGRLRALAAMALKRAPEFPEVPTTVELGYPELTSYTWAGLVGPSGMKADTVEVVHRGVLGALTDPETRSAFARYSLQVETSAPQEFQRLIDVDYHKWLRVITAG